MLCYAMLWQPQAQAQAGTQAQAQAQAQARAHATLGSGWAPEVAAAAESVL